MDKNVKITIVVPVYNDELYVEKCLDSLVSQSLKEIEIIVVDDCSSDGSLKILKRYSEQYNQIKVIAFDENRSAFQARKAAVENSHGEFIMFVDADDSLQSDACQILWNLEQKNTFDIVHFGTNVITTIKDKKELDGYKKLINPHNEVLYGDEIFKMFVERNFEGHLWNKIFKRELCVFALSKTENKILPKGQDKYFYWIMAFYARSYKGYPDVNLYNYNYGAGVEGVKTNISLERFEIFCKQAWTENEIELFMEKNAENNNFYKNVLEKSRRNMLRHCMKNWNLLSDKDKGDGLILAQNYWNKDGDSSNLVGAICNLYKDKQEELSDLIKIFLFQSGKKKSIKTIATYYHIYNNGGIQRVISKLMKIWIDNGYNVILFTDFEEKESDYELPDGVRRVTLAKSGREAGNNYLDRGKDLENKLKKYNVDVMIYHEYLGNSLFWDLMLCKFINIPFVLYYHNVFTKYMLFSDERFCKIPRIAQGCDCIVVLNDIDKKFWDSYNQNVFVVNNPLTFNLEEIETSSLENKFIIWVGRLDEIHKRFQEPVTIMREVLKRVPDAKLFIVGKDDSGKNYQRLQQRISKLHLEDSIILCGFQKDVAPFYKNASVYLMTSSHEGSPMTLIEAQSFGLPVVMYELPYLNIVQDNDGIISVKQEDVEGAAKEICQLIQNTEYRREVGAESRKYIEKKYKNNDVEIEWNEIFKSLYQSTGHNIDVTERLMFDTILQHYKMSLDIMQKELDKAKQQKENTGDDRKKILNENQKLKIDLISCSKTIESLQYDQYCLNEVRKSFSYKLGLFLTAIPRKIIFIMKKSKGAQNE